MKTDLILLAIGFAVGVAASFGLPKLKALISSDEAKLKAFAKKGIASANGDKAAAVAKIKSDLDAQVAKL